MTRSLFKTWHGKTPDDNGGAVASSEDVNGTALAFMGGTLITIEGYSLAGTVDPVSYPQDEGSYQVIQPTTLSNR
jgi:hypothetical protein